MGLSITAHSKLGEFVAPEVSEEMEDEGGFIFLFVHKPESSNQSDGIKTGAYRVVDDCEKTRFRAGSYSGYNAWRNDLARIAGYPAPSNGRHDRGAWEANGGPFWELINFSDCEGLVGPDTSAKLHNDFLTYGPASLRESEYFHDTYRSFKQAFLLASKGGFVKFH